MLIQGQYKETRGFTMKKCEVCSSERHIESHHIDSDKSNNSKSNLIDLCSSCHRQVHHDSGISHLKDDQILELKEKLPEKTEQEVKCAYCGYIWVTKSVTERVTCPSCNSKTKRLDPDEDE